MASPEDQCAAPLPPPPPPPLPKNVLPGSLLWAAPAELPPRCGTTLPLAIAGCPCRFEVFKFLLMYYAQYIQKKLGVPHFLLLMEF